MIEFMKVLDYAITTFGDSGINNIAVAKTEP
jgi:hypothetical protein